MKPMSIAAPSSTAAEPLALARSSILAPAGLDDARLGRALDLVLGSAVDSADLYFQLAHEESPWDELDFASYRKRRPAVTLGGSGLCIDRCAVSARVTVSITSSASSSRTPK